MNSTVFLETSTSLTASDRASRLAGRATGVVLLMCLLFVVVVSHLAFIDADPPYWVEEAFIVDGGWWASSARAKVLFNDYLSGDFGMSYLLLPAYTWVLKEVYVRWGVGIPQTQIVSAIANILIVVIVALLVWRLAGRREALLAAALLGLNPFFWSEGRLGLPEPMQAFFIVASFGLWMLGRESRIAAFGSGVAMAMAVAVKPTALLIGFVPLTLAGLAVYCVGRSKQSADPSSQEQQQTRFRAMLALAALFLVLSVLFFVHFSPNWEAVRLNFSTEKGTYGMDWRQVLTIPGRALVSLEIGEEGYFSPVFWRIAKWSPALIAGVWFYFLWLLLRFRAGIRATLQSMSALEIASATWVLSAWLVICTYPLQPDYRYLSTTPGMAILGGLFFSRALTSTELRISPPPPHIWSGWIFSFLLWALLSFPLFLVLKPWTARLIVEIGRNVPLGDQPGIAYGSAGTLFMGAWLLALWLLASFRRKGQQFAHLVLGRFPAILLPVLLLFQCWVIGQYFADAQTTLADRQVALARYVKDGDIVLGRVAATLFLPLRVQTIRRLAINNTPLETFDSPSRLTGVNSSRPRHAVVPKLFNFRPYGPHQGIHEDLVKEGYEAIFEFDVGPTREGKPRFRFELLRQTHPRSSI